MSALDRLDQLLNAAGRTPKEQQDEWIESWNEACREAEATGEDAGELYYRLLKVPRWAASTRSKITSTPLTESECARADAFYDLFRRGASDEAIDAILACDEMAPEMIERFHRELLEEME